MSPKGVEHLLRDQVAERYLLSVHSSMSPKGVEHLKNKATYQLAASWCIHQCRRKALSTPKQSETRRRLKQCIHQCRRKALSTAGPSQAPASGDAVHSSMSPKGVEHARAICHPCPSSGVCIHQCRRKALSTERTVGELVREQLVHSSMSPKGVEHIDNTYALEHKLDVHSSMSPKGVEHFVPRT